MFNSTSLLFMKDLNCTPCLAFFLYSSILPSDVVGQPGGGLVMVLYVYGSILLFKLIKYKNN